jgi:hypothetical protein
MVLLLDVGFGRHERLYDYIWHIRRSMDFVREHAEVSGFSSRVADSVDFEEDMKNVWMKSKLL